MTSGGGGRNICQHRIDIVAVDVFSPQYETCDPDPGIQTGKIRVYKYRCGILHSINKFLYAIKENHALNERTFWRIIGYQKK
jgi:hypothetical protein